MIIYVSIETIFIFQRCVILGLCIRPGLLDFTYPFRITRLVQSPKRGIYSRDYIIVEYNTFPWSDFCRLVGKGCFRTNVGFNLEQTAHFAI